MPIANSIKTIYLSQNLSIQAVENHESLTTDENSVTKASTSNGTPESKGGLNSIKGYLYGLIYTILDCYSYILIKKAPALNGFEHAVTRFVIQIVSMSFLVYKNKLTIVQEKAITNVLLIRGISGATALLLGFLSLQFIDVSDTQSLINSSVLITALMGRIFLKEKINICHVISMILTFLGVLFILRPSFLFGIEENLENVFKINITEHNLNNTITSNQNSKSIFQLSDSINKIIGVSLTIANAVCLSVMQVSTRSLSNSNIHYSLITLYPAFFGLPIAILGSLSLFLINYDLSRLSSLTIYDGGYSISAGSIGILGVVFLNLALKYEDAAKIALLRISGVLFSMIFQYFILNVGIDFLGILGAIFIVLGTLFIILVKMFSQDILESKKFYRVIAVEF